MWDLHTSKYSWLFVQMGFAHTRIFMVICARGICTHQDIRGYLHMWDLHTPEYSWLFTHVGFGHSRISVVMFTYQDIRGYLRPRDLHTPRQPTGHTHPPFMIIILLTFQLVVIKDDYFLTVPNVDYQI